ncbi:MAG: Type 1 glutamine amidotransferase-like domain-containing protein [Patescibacteria group bacterium]|nr:Type 1 glutamine amidotransferase-like domain-containing protein [Patescibacteria group bacterium]MDD4304174.1 Type 1 glutamine amidotransferase-like domain-containing protein [Patescibacteria group bacterium]MDD4695206.1 Type 1 glutamine amidotransferase-like domain-containing protein [Patescibacteria group bacterium]
MKLFLSSDGLSTQNLKKFFISKLPKKAKDCSLLLIFYKLDIEPEAYIEYTKEKIKSIGITNVTPFDMHNDKFTDNKKHFDIIWVCGGNTFCILDRMKKTDIFDFVKRSVIKNNSLYFGVSAGSIIAGYNIKLAGWGSESDENIIKLKNLTGLNLTNISILPHFKPNMKKELQKFKKTVDYHIIEINDEEAVFIEDENYRIIK